MADGARGDIISLYPPLTFGEDHIAELLERLDGALSDVERDLAMEVAT
jgi:4-aminobutyrate aminotransferase-like enzyme